MKAAQLARVVVDEEVAAKDALVAAKDDVRCGDEWEVFVQPFEFGIEAGRDFHCGGCDEDLIARLQPGDHALRVGHDAENGEEVFGEHVIEERLLAVLGDDVPEPLAMKIGGCDAFAKVAVVAEKVLAQGVSDDLIHVDADYGPVFRIHAGIHAVQRTHEVCSAVVGEGRGPVRRSPATQVRGVSRRGSQKRMRPQVSQVKSWSS